MMSSSDSSDLPKLGIELTKIGHIFRKQSTFKNPNFQKVSLFKVDLLVNYSSQKKKKNQKDSVDF